MCSVWRFLTSLLASSFVVLFVIFFPSQAWAQAGGIGDGETITTNPKDREITVTAFVPDVEVPSTPILIAPEDDSVLNTAPNFSWYGVTDNVQVSHYQLWIDNVLFVDAISHQPGTYGPTQANLTWDSGTNTYVLDPDTAPDQGTHTWKIVAVDTTGNEAHSVTWVFRFDNQAPEFVIETIEDYAVEIRASDPSSIPSIDDPYLLESTDPTLTGTGETDSTVELDVVMHATGAVVREASFTIENGTWSLDLSNLPRESLLTLSFIITDTAGNIRLLEDVPIYIQARQIVITLPTLPSIIQPSPTPTPQPGTSPIPTPRPTPTPPAIVIPIPDISQPIKRVIPAPIIELTEELQAVSRVRETTGWSIWNWIVPIGTALLIAARLSLLARRFGNRLTWGGVRSILRILGLAGERRLAGCVIDTETQRPSPLTVVQWAGTTVSGTPQSATVITDTDGIFEIPDLPRGTYRATPIVPGEKQYPTRYERPAFLSLEQYYKDDEIGVFDASRWPPVCIPVDNIYHDDQLTDIAQARSLERLTLLEWDRAGGFTWVICATLYTLWFATSLPNLLTIGLIGLHAYRLKRTGRVQPTQVVAYEASDKQPAAGLLCLWIQADSGTLSAVSYHSDPIENLQLVTLSDTPHYCRVLYFGSHVRRVLIQANGQQSSRSHHNNQFTTLHDTSDVVIEVSQ